MTFGELVGVCDRGGEIGCGDVPLCCSAAIRSFNVEGPVIDLPKRHILDPIHFETHHDDGPRAYIAQEMSTGDNNSGRMVIGKGKSNKNKSIKTT